MIRVFLADDHPVIRDGIERLLDLESDLEFAGSATTAEETLRRAGTEEWTVLVLDLSLPSGGGLHVLEHLPALRPRLPVIVFTMHSEREFGPRVLAAGAVACLSKSRPIDELLAAIRAAAAGRRTITGEVAEKLLLQGKGAAHESLSRREHQVFLMLAEGRRPIDIARALGLSKQTVSTHSKNIRRKLDVGGAAEMAHYALRHGLLKSEVSY